MPELQNLRDFTVRILNPETNELKGTGIVISVDRVITCAHVIEAVLGVAPKEAADRKIGVYFPLISSTETKTRHAIVIGCPTQHDDDIVTLRLIDGPAPLGPEQIAILGSAENSDGHEFLSYGYSPTLEYPGTRADGHILGPVEPPAGKKLRSDPIQISSQQIDYGMSGAAVLDTKLNLVVGLVAARYFPETWKKGDIAFAVDAKVLTFDPFFFKLREEALPLRTAPVIKIDVVEAIASARKEPGLAWNNAPPYLQEWVGRADLLNNIIDDWINSEKRVTGLIGFDGEGKSSLARRWIDDLLKDKTSPKPDGIFWWGFYDRPSVDEFFEAALNYLSGCNVDLARSYPSTSARVHLLAGMLHGGRYLFILDGLEGLQHQEGDQFGLLESNDIREFLRFFAAPDHDSFCIVTSCVPLLDMMEYTTYQHLDVERLNAANGRALLKNLGVNGDDKELDKVVADWDGHALMLSIIGSYIADQYDGDISHIKDLPAPTADEPRYERVHNALKCYDEHLNEEERTFLKIFSAFRIPVDRTAFDDVFRAKPQGSLNRILGRKTEAISSSIAALDDVAFEQMIKQLIDYRILRIDLRSGKYTTHPMIRSHYYDLLLIGDQSLAIYVHRRLEQYYLIEAGDLAIFTMDDIKPFRQLKEYFRIKAVDLAKPTLDDLKPLIEAVHHACQSGDYDFAFNTILNCIQRKRSHLSHELGAYETELLLMQEFFPDGDTSKDPLVSSHEDKSFILNDIGVCLKNLGKLELAKQFLERANFIVLNITKDWLHAGIIYENLSELYASMGALDHCKETARQEFELSIRMKNRLNECHSIAYQAYQEHLRGNLAAASENFTKAEALEREIDHTKQYLYSIGGVYHANHLIRIGNATYAQKVTETNLKICENGHWLVSISRCQRLLGDLDADAGDQTSAKTHYNESLKIAREITHREVLIEALLARGRWAAKHMKIASEAFNDLDEALNYAASGGYRIFEADIRVALVWANLVAGDKEKAKAEAQRAKQLSGDMGYYWGNKDADEVLTEIGKT